MTAESISTPSGGQRPVTFSGSVRRRPLGFGFSFGGRLTIEDRQLSISGPGSLLSVRKDEVQAIVVRRGFLANRVSVRLTDGAISDLYFATESPSEVRSALVTRGWPVEL